MRKEQVLAKSSSSGSTGGHEAADRSTKTNPKSPHGAKNQNSPKADQDETDGSWNSSKFKVPPVDGQTRFHDFDLPDPLMHAIQDLGFEYCTPIQAQIMPSTLNGEDASGRAQTGTGKTAAFLISVLSRMLRHPVEGKRKSGTPRVLILAPTRELVMQISEEARALSKYCQTNIISVFGGMDYVKQQKQLGGKAVDIVVATPGRLLDFQRRGDISLRKVETLIIDEADRMLDMGFIPDVRKIIHSTPSKDKRQTLLFSATLTREITRLSAQWTKDPVVVEVEPEQVAVDTVDQIIYIVTMDEKFGLLYNVIEKQALDRVLIFCNRKDEVRRLTEMLTRYSIDCQMISGDVPQKKRMSRLDAFKAGKIRVMVATDVAGRGIHIEGMNHVVNFTLPRDPEDYVHRIGRTGRAGTLGTSISFADEDDAFYIPAIEDYLGRKLDCIEPPDEWLVMPPAPPRKKQQKSQEADSASGSRRRKSKSGRRGRRGNSR